MKKKIKITESELTNLIKKTVKKVLNEGIGAMWVTKIRIDDMDDTSEEEKSHLASKLGSQFNGPIAVEFAQGEWYNSRGERVDDVESYDNDVMNSWGGEDKVKDFKDKVTKHHRNTDMDSPHQYKYNKSDIGKKYGI